MGGYGSGGHNRTHGKVENQSKVDSFNFYDYLKGDKYLHYKVNVDYRVTGGKIVYHVPDKTASMYIDGAYCPLELSRVANVDGKSQRMYFLCPECGKRSRFLYKRHSGYVCRNCAKLNYDSQQKSGREELIHKMRCIVEKKLEYPYWYYEHPNTMLPELSFVPRPPYMRLAKYDRLMQELKKLQKEYLLLEMRSLGKWGRSFEL